MRSILVAIAAWTLLTASPGWSDDRPAESTSEKSKAQKRSTRSSTPATPLVPGFGEPNDLTIPLGFDVPLDSPLLSTVPLEERYDRRVIEYVDRVFYRYDRNRNKQIDPEEWKEVSWSSDPHASDLNQDGILSRLEFCERIARRWGGASRKQSSRDSSHGQPSSFGATSSGSGQSSGKVDDRIRRYAESLIKRYDDNKNGVLEKDEWTEMRGYPRESDSNGDGVLTKSELTARLANYGKNSSSSSSSSVSSNSKPPSSTSSSSRSYRRSPYGSRYSRSSSSSSSKHTKSSYRFLTPSERLPKGLPDWFLRSDANGDGQVMMAEYSTTWNASKAAEFAKYDTNRDGFITAAECLAETK